MKLVSVNVGLPRNVPWRGESVRTGIFKEPVAGPVAVAGVNLAGDAQADLSVHGGPDKAVYAYPAEHYPWWREELPDHELAWGGFGENLTTAGLLEDALCIGDRLRAGTAVLRVTQPRSPCFKLGIRFGRPDMVKRFLRSGRPGFYLAIDEPGEVEAGAPLARLERDPLGVSVSDVLALQLEKRPSRESLERAAGHPALARSWRDDFARRLERA